MRSLRAAPTRHLPMAQSGESARFGSERLVVRIHLGRPERGRAGSATRSNTHADVAQLAEVAVSETVQ